MTAVAGIRPVIVTGAPRSGTTLLYRLLDGVPGIFNFLDEGYFFEVLHDLGPAGRAAFLRLHQEAPVAELVRAAAERMLFTFFDDGYAQTSGTVNVQRVDVDFDAGVLAKTLDEARAAGGATTVERLWHAWLLAFMRAMGADPASTRFAVLKSPDYGRSGLAVHETLTDPRVLLVVRDPIYAIDSLKRSRAMRRTREVNAFELLRVIGEYHRLVENSRALAAHHAQRTLVVRYEDLVAGTPTVMGSVAAFVGTPLDPAMLTPTINRAPWYGLSSFHRLEGVSTASTLRKIETLAPWEIRFIRAELAEFFQRFGYS